MLLVREQYLKKISLALTTLSVNLDLTNSSRLFDANVVSEDFFCDFLNVLYDLSLVNLNVAEPGLPAIDLGDEVEGVAVQVTADGSKDKIRDTLAKFARHQLFTKFKRLQIIIIGERRGEYKGLARTAPISFDPATDVKGIKQLVGDVQAARTRKLSSLCELIDREMPLIKKMMIGDADSGDGSGGPEGQPPDVRVRVRGMMTGIPGFGQTETMLAITVENHSSQVVFMEAVSFRLTSGRVMRLMQDGLTGEPHGKRKLQPGDSYTISVPVEHVVSQVRPDEIVCAVASDAIGRKYESSPKDIMGAFITSMRIEKLRR